MILTPIRHWREGPIPSPRGTRRYSKGWITAWDRGYLPTAPGMKGTTLAKATWTL